MRRFGMALMIASLAACGGSDSDSDSDAAVPADAGPSGPDAYEDCGDGLVTGNEQCDDDNNSNDDECLNDCTLACGDGVVNAVETCDTAIAAGETGACPTDCDDSNACTFDSLNGDGCQAECINSEITAFTDDDGCCPMGGDNTLDNDCPVVCGNGVVEDGETCDTSIASGPGACPVASDCDDGIACTEDNLIDAGTCTATCENTTITDPVDDDGCCPANQDISTDNDCPPGCGDGVVTSPETCDTAIASGEDGSCPEQSDCDDSDACTEDTLVSDGTCVAECENTTIDTADDGTDGCCPAGANNNTDPNCPVVCGNNATETGEECDDGNTDPGDGCDENCQIEIGPTAFRVDQLLLRDPNAFTLAFGLFCTNITGNVNDAFNDAITMDGDGDGLLDLSIAQVFRPLDQAASTNDAEEHFPDCTAPLSSTTCTRVGTGEAVTATNQNSGTCLEPIAGTTGGYSPGITTPTAPCFVNNAVDLAIDADGLVITLRDAQVAATYVGAPATNLVNGLIMGFLTEEDADNTTIPDDVAVVGGQPLSAILPGGGGDADCSGNDDRDIHNGESGWWIYMNFTADRVPWID